MVNVSLKRIALLSIVSVFFLSCDTEDIGELSFIETEIFSRVNSYREEQGLTPLVNEEYLTIEAREHSTNMGDKIVGFGHGGFTDRVRRIKNRLGSENIEENVARGQITANEVMTTWLTSLENRANIEGDYSHIGIGAYTSSEGINYFTQIFIKIEGNLEQ